MFVTGVIAGPIFEEREIVLAGKLAELFTRSFRLEDRRIWNAKKFTPAFASEICGESLTFVIIFVGEKGDARICQRERDG